MKKRFWNRDRVLYLTVMVLSILFLYVGNRIAVQDNSYFQSSRAETYYRSEVIAVGEPRIIANPTPSRTSPSVCWRGRSGGRR